MKYDDAYRMKYDDGDDRFEWLSFGDYIGWIIIASLLCLLINGGWILTILGFAFLIYGLYRRAEAQYYFDVVYPKICEENKRKFEEELANMTEEEKLARERIINSIHK